MFKHRTSIILTPALYGGGGGGGGSPAELGADTFNRANAALSSPWSNNDSSWNISTNAIIPLSKDADAAARYTGPTWTNNQYSEVTMGTCYTFGGVGVGCGPCVFMDTGGAVTFYRLVINGSGYELLRFNSGTPTSIVSSSGTTATAGDVIRLEVNGSTGAWVLKKNTSTFDSGTDASHLTSGAAGVGYSSTASIDNTAGIDSWAGGSL